MMDKTLQKIWKENPDKILTLEYSFDDIVDDNFECLRYYPYIKKLCDFCVDKLFDGFEPEDGYDIQIEINFDEYILKIFGHSISREHEESESFEMDIDHLDSIEDV